MEENKALHDALEELKSSNRKQALYGKLQCVFTAIAALCCAGVLALVWSLLPMVWDLGAQAETTLTNLDTALAGLETTLTNLEGITDQLAAADLAGMVDGIDGLVATSQKSVEAITGKLSAIDFETLNDAIRDLADVVEPLAKFFNVFN